MKSHLTITAVLFSLYLHSQPNFTQQALYSPMCINPAFTAVKNILSPDTSHTRLVDVLTDANIGNDDYNLLATLQMPFDKIHSSIGIMYNYNSYTLDNGWDALVERRDEDAFKLYYSYAILPKLSAGISVGYVYMVGYRPYMPVDADIGISYHSKIVFAGLSAGHITEPSYNDGYANKVSMPYYNGVALNTLLGFNIVVDKTRIVLSESLYNYNLAFHLLFYPVKWFYAGMAWTNYYDGTQANPSNAIPSLSDIQSNGCSVISFMGGFSMCKNKLSLSLALNFYYGMMYSWNFRSYSPYNYDTEFDTGIGF